MYWNQLGTFTQVASVIVTVLAFAAIGYVFFWGRVSWLPPWKKK